MIFVQIKTLNREGINERNVNVAMGRDKDPYLMGNLEHGTSLVIDQKLVDELQKIVNKLEGVKK